MSLKTVDVHSLGNFILEVYCIMVAFIHSVKTALLLLARQLLMLRIGKVQARFHANCSGDSWNCRRISARLFPGSRMTNLPQLFFDAAAAPLCRCTTCHRNSSVASTRLCRFCRLNDCSILLSESYMSIFTVAFFSLIV